MSTDPPPTPIDVKAEVIRLITNSRRTIASIASEAGVEYDILYRFYRGTTKTLDANIAEKVRVTLTRRLSL